MVILHATDSKWLHYEAGTLLSERPALSAEQVLQMTETSIVAVQGLPDADAQAQIAARFCLQALLRDPGRLSNLERDAESIDCRIEAPNFA